jgi:hypothetical protein
VRLPLTLETVGALSVTGTLAGGVIQLPPLGVFIGKVKS